MAAVTIKTQLLKYTQDPEKTVALAAKLCYSDSDIEHLQDNVQAKDISAYIKGLMNAGHLSPIEHASFTFGIEGVSRALLAQITRHRLASFSVKSQRYVSSSDFNYIVPPSISKLGNEYHEKYVKQMQTLAEWYSDWQSVLGQGESANEDARFVLPNAAETKFVLTMNARELLHFFSLRCCLRAQWEIRELAWQMLGLVKDIAPNIFAKAGPSCLYDRCSEGKHSCGQAALVKEIHKQRFENK